MTEISITKETTLEKDGRTVQYALWSDGSHSLELWDGRFYWWNPDTQEVWNLTHGQKFQVVVPRPGISLEEFLTRYTQPAT